MPQKALVSLQRRCSNNLNQVAIHAHTYGVYPEEIAGLAVDIQAKLAAGKGPGYERWAKVFNLKQMAATLAYLQDNELTEYGQFRWIRGHLIYIWHLSSGV